MYKKLKELESLAKRIVDLSTVDDDMISQDNLFRLQVEANDLYHQIKDLRKKEESSNCTNVSIKHGKWVDIYGGKYDNPRYKCSVCGEKALYKTETDELGHAKPVQALTPICPYCFANMDGKDK